MASEGWLFSSLVVIETFSLSQSLPFCAFVANFNIKIFECLPLFWLHLLIMC